MFPKLFAGFIWAKLALESIVYVHLNKNGFKI